MQRIIPQIPHVCSGTYPCMWTIMYVSVNQPSEVRKHLRLCLKTLCASYKSAVNHWCSDVCVQKAIKEKDIPIEGVEFMGPNREKPDSWCSCFILCFIWTCCIRHKDCIADSDGHTFLRLYITLLVKLLNGDYLACLSCQYHWGFFKHARKCMCALKWNQLCDCL